MANIDRIESIAQAYPQDVWSSQVFFNRRSDEIHCGVVVEPADADGDFDISTVERRIPNIEPGLFFSPGMQDSYEDVLREIRAIARTGEL